MNPNESEKNKIISEWLEKARHDLASAAILLKETQYYDIVAYHSHQAIEKFLKAKLLENDKTFKFSHDLNSLFSEAGDLLSSKISEEEISFVNSLYPKLRYPTGDQVSADDAQRCLAIAKKIVQ